MFTSKINNAHNINNDEIRARGPVRIRHWPSEPRIVGSNPTGPATFAY